MKWNEFKAFRKRLNTFFMNFVSGIVFSEGDDPEDSIIEWLLKCVTFGTTDTREFSLFNTADVVDPTPVLRSFLLKLLLQCKQRDSVHTHLNKLLSKWSTNKIFQLQTMVLLMDCHKVQVSLLIFSILSF